MYTYGYSSDLLYMLLVVVPTLVISALAKYFVDDAYSKWIAHRNAPNMTGKQIGQQLITAEALSGVRFETIPGKLTDHYTPSSNVVSLSEAIATENSVASMAIVAHELGHAQQHAQRSAWLAVRSIAAPAAVISPYVAVPLITLGLIVEVAELMWLGVVCFGAVALFMILTVPVEIDASRRGLTMLEKSGLLYSDADREGAREVLRAAAFTYIAAMIQSLLQLLYYAMKVLSYARYFKKR